MESNKIWRILLDVWAEQHQVNIEIEEAHPVPTAKPGADDLNHKNQ